MVAVVGDGTVGLSAVLTSKRYGAERIIALSRNAERQKLALAPGATDIIKGATKPPIDKPGSRATADTAERAARITTARSPLRDLLVREARSP